MIHYYLPIDTVNLNQYFRRGIVSPSTYIDDWHTDLQSKYDSVLLLCSKPLTKETNCSLTIIFTEDELKEIKQLSENFYAYNKPISIARVKNINFFDKEQSDTTVYNIEQGDAFIPRELIKILDRNEMIDCLELDNVLYKSSNQDWEEKIKLYDKTLGGFSIMRIANFPELEYPKNYFNVFSSINKYVKEQIKNFRFDESYSNAIDINSINFYQQIDKGYVEKFAIKHSYNLPVKRGLIKVEEIDSKNKIYNLAILATYGEDIGKVKKISDFIAALTSDQFATNRKELLSLVFGINQGYSIFRNQYSIEDQVINTKFELNSEVDYTIIESIYQYVFNGIRDNTNFPYISEWCPIYHENKNLDNYETYEIFDKEIVYKKKALLGSAEYLQELFQVFSNNSDINSTFTIVREDIVSLFRETIEIIYKKIKNDIEVEHGKKIVTLNDEIEKLKLDIVELKEKSGEVSQQITLENKDKPVINSFASSLPAEELEENKNIQNSSDEIKEAEQSCQVIDESIDKNLKLDNSKVQQLVSDIGSAASENPQEDVLKLLAKDINSIADLKTIARYAGIDEVIYRKYKKESIDELRGIIIKNKSKTLIS